MGPPLQKQRLAHCQGKNTAPQWEGCLQRRESQVRGLVRSICGLSAAMKVTEEVRGVWDVKGKSHTIGYVKDVVNISFRKKNSVTDDFLSLVLRHQGKRLDIRLKAPDLGPDLDELSGLVT